MKSNSMNVFIIKMIFVGMLRHYARNLYEHYKIVIIIIACVVYNIKVNYVLECDELFPFKKHAIDFFLVMAFVDAWCVSFVCSLFTKKRELYLFKDEIKEHDKCNDKNDDDCCHENSSSLVSADH